MRLTKSEGRIGSLSPTSTRSKNFRCIQTDPKVYEFIKNLRINNPRLGKEKIKPLLDEIFLKRIVKLKEYISENGKKF